MPAEKKRRTRQIALGLALIVIGTLSTLLLLIRGPQLWNIGGFMALMYGVFLLLPGDKKTFLSP